MTSTEIPRQRQDDLPPVVPEYQGRETRKCGRVEQGIHATDPPVTGALKVAGRFAPGVEHLFDEGTLLRRHTLPFRNGERCVEFCVNGGENVLYGHAGWVVATHNPILRQEVGGNAKAGDSRDGRRLRKVTV